MPRIFECSACGRLAKSDKDLSLAPCSKCNEGAMIEFERAAGKQQQKIPAPKVKGAVSQEEYKERGDPAILAKAVPVASPSKDELKDAYMEGFKEGVQHGFDSGFLTGREAEQIKMASNMPDEDEENEYENGPISEEDLDDAEGDMGEEE